MYTLLGCTKHKCRDSYVLYILTVHAFGLVLLTHTLLVQTHTHDVSAPWFLLFMKIVILRNKSIIVKFFFNVENTITIWKLISVYHLNIFFQLNVEIKIQTIMEHSDILFSLNQWERNKCQMLTFNLSIFRQLTSQM